MPRGKSLNRTPREPDFKYKSKVVSKLINMVMEHGKKSLAEKMVYDALDSLDAADIKEKRQYFEDAIKNLMPEMEVRSRRVGGANYQIPMPVRHDRSETLALRWLVDSSRSQKGSPFSKNLLEQIRLAFQNEGAAIKKKQDTHRMADANRAFSHFRW